MILLGPRAYPDTKVIGYGSPVTTKMTVGSSQVPLAFPRHGAISFAWMQDLRCDDLVLAIDKVTTFLDLMTVTSSFLFSIPKEP
jgi:hypothetical protein